MIWSLEECRKMKPDVSNQHSYQTWKVLTCLQHLALLTWLLGSSGWNGHIVGFLKVLTQDYSKIKCYAIFQNQICLRIAVLRTRIDNTGHIASNTIPIQ